MVDCLRYVISGKYYYILFWIFQIIPTGDPDPNFWSPILRWNDLVSSRKRGGSINRDFFFDSSLDKMDGSFCCVRTLASAHQHIGQNRVSQNFAILCLLYAKGNFYARCLTSKEKLNYNFAIPWRNCLDVAKKALATASLIKETWLGLEFPKSSSK